MDLGLLPDPLPLQFGFTCSDVADAAIVANAQYQDAKVGFKDLFFAAISQFASYVKNDLRHGVPPANPFQIARSEAALVLKEVEGPSTVAVIALNGVAQQFYSHYVARTQMGIIAAVWNDMNCGSGHVTAGVEIIAGNPVSFHGTMYLVCVEEWIDLVIGGNTYQVRANVCYDAS
jgi:hypothetical protein